ncbi:TonB-dependent receptor domain-containing protein, partial [Bowmanella dokdonensis]
GLPLVSTPKNMLNATLNWQVLDDLNVSLVGEVRSKRFRGTADVQGPQGPQTVELYYKSYELLHLAARYQVNDNLAIHGRINNLLDENLSTRSCLLSADELG